MYKRQVIVVALVGLSMMFKVPETALFEQEEAKAGSIATYYSFSGNVAPHDKKSLTADGNLKVKQLMVEEGDTVNVGDVLYTVDNLSLIHIYVRKPKNALSIKALNRR